MLVWKVFSSDKLLQPLQVATGQIASTGIVALSYVQKVSEKVRVCSLINHRLFAGVI